MRLSSGLKPPRGLEKRGAGGDVHLLWLNPGPGLLWLEDGAGCQSPQRGPGFGYVGCSFSLLVLFGFEIPRGIASV